MLEEGNSERARGPEGRFLCWSALVPGPTRRDGWLWCQTLSRVKNWKEVLRLAYVGVLALVRILSFWGV